MDAKNAGNRAAHDEGDTDGARNLVPPLVLTADQMAQVHQAEYLMDVGELERPQADDGTVREENAILRDALHDVCVSALSLYQLISDIQSVIYNDSTTDEDKWESIHHLLGDADVQAAFHEIWAAFEPVMTEEDLVEADAIADAEDF